MLLTLLRLISSSERVSSIAEVAREMGVGEGLLERMIEDATRLGYLRAMEDRCGGAACHGCDDRPACTHGGSPRVWSLTDKGRRVLDPPANHILARDG